MANLIQFLNKTKTIDAKCEIIVNKVLNEYAVGTIKTEVEMLYKLKQALKEFYYSIGKPTYKFNGAKGTPISEHFNNMTEKAYNDLKIMIEECDNISNVLQASFVDVELSRKMLANKIKYINKKLDDISNLVIINNNTGITAFADSFVNLDYIENNTSSTTILANINTVDGILTLATTSYNDYTSLCKVEVLDESNGFPGNTHMVDVLDGDLHFIGENNLHLDLNDLIDNNSDTWFEYEAFNVEDKTMDDCNSFGFKYKEDISWVIEDSNLKLIIKLILDVPTKCNWLSLSPFISESKAAKASMITKVIISDGDTNIQTIDTDNVFGEDTVVLFTPQIVRDISIEFNQSTPYGTNIGHNYFTKTSTLNSMVFDTIQSSLYSRVEGDNPTISLLGMKYDPSTKKCIQPKNYNVNAQDNTIDPAYIKKVLFTIPSDSNNMKCSREVLAAYRYFIGIKSITIANYEFESNSEYISKPFKTNEFIASITLEAEESIPKEFDQYIDDNPELTEYEKWEKGQWIKYSISFDNGANWESIWPKHRAFQGPCTMKINSDTPKHLRDVVNTMYIDKLIEPTSVRIKINLLRPIAEIYKTPVVFQYRLSVLTGGESVEY